MRKLVKVCACALVLFLLLQLCACLNPVSIDSCGYVVAIGADMGKEKRYDVVLELQRESSGDISDSNGGSIILECEADNLFEAINELDSRISFSLNFTRTHVFLFGEQLAKEGLIPDFLKASFDVLRIRQSALMMMTRCSVLEYISGIAANNGANVSKIQDDIISDVHSTGEIAATNVALFFEAADGGWFDAAMPVGYFDESIITDTKQRDNTTKGETPIKDAKQDAKIGGMQGITIGCAVFDGTKLAAILDGHETQFVNMGRGDFAEGTIDYPICGEGTAAIYLKLKDRRIKVEVGDKPRIAAELCFNVTIEYDPSGAIGNDWNNGAKELLSGYLSTKLKEVFEKCRDNGSDAMGFGRSAAKQFFTTAEFESFDWKSVYRNAEADFSVELILDDEYVAELRQ